MDQLGNWLRQEGLRTGLDILLAGLVLLLGVVFARLSKKWLDPVMERSRIKDDLLLRSFFLRVLSVVIVTVAALAALQVLSFDVKSFVAGLGITGIILGFGFKDTLANLAAGLLLLIYRPFKAGDLIEVEGTQGTVEELTIVNMQMTTVDGVRVIMPNSKVWGAKITNYSVSAQRSVEFTLKVRESDVRIAIDSISRVFAEDERVKSDPPLAIRVVGIATNCATLRVVAWTQANTYANLCDDGYLKLRLALGEAEIPIQ